MMNKNFLFIYALIAVCSLLSVTTIKNKLKSKVKNLKNLNKVKSKQGDQNIIQVISDVNLDLAIEDIQAVVDGEDDSQAFVDFTTQLRSDFNSDSNSDISVREFVSGMRKLVQKYQLPSDKLSRTYIQSTFTDCDEDGNGSLNENEFNTLARKISQEVLDNYSSIADGSHPSAHQDVLNIDLKISALDALLFSRSNEGREKLSSAIKGLFDSEDITGRGYLTPGEVEDVLIMLGEWFDLVPTQVSSRFVNSSLKRRGDNIEFAIFEKVANGALRTIKGLLSRKKYELMRNY